MRDTNQDSVTSSRTQKHGPIRGQSRDILLTFFAQKDSSKAWRELSALSLQNHLKGAEILETTELRVSVPWKVASENEAKLVWMKQGNVLVLWQAEVEEGRTTEGKESFHLSSSFLCSYPEELTNIHSLARWMNLDNFKFLILSLLLPCFCMHFWGLSTQRNFARVHSLLIEKFTILIFQRLENK